MPERKLEYNSASAPRLVQSLGLFSSTALVVGSMIGSGIFIVDADIARGTNSPALFLGAWVLTAVLTMIGALSYGELAAMMPKAGGQYVYLRESLGPLWGFLYGWTLFLVIQTGTIAAVAVAFGKFLGVFFPAISTTHWLWHIAHVPALRVGPMVLGNMEIGVSTANLTAIAVVILLAIVNIFGVKLGALIQNIFTSAKALSLAALILLAFTVGRNATAWRPTSARAGGVLAECRLEFAASGAGGHRRADGAGESAGDSGRGAGGFAVLRRRVEQHYLHGRRGEESQAQYSALAGSGHGICADGLFSGLAGLPAGAADARRSERRYGGGARHSICDGGSRGDGGSGADLPLRRGVPDGRSDSDLHLRLRQRHVAGRGARLLRDEPGRIVLQDPWASCTRATRRRRRACWCRPRGPPCCASRAPTASCWTTLSSRCWCFTFSPSSASLCCASSGPMRRGRTRRWAIRVLPALYIALAAWICIVLLRYKPQYTWPGLVLVLLGIPVYLFWSRKTSTGLQA